MQPLDINEFLQKFAAGTHTEAEHQQFADWLLHAPVTAVEKALDTYSSIVHTNVFSSEAADAAGLTTLVESALDQYELGRTASAKKPFTIGWRNLVKIAAVFIIFLSAAAIWLTQKKGRSTIPDVTLAQPKPPLKNEVLPGVNKATLTLANGAVISLDDTKSGKIARQGNMIIDKSSNGQLVYKAAAAATPSFEYNTLAIPRGGKFRLVLADGSEIWLNAATTITYPTAFPGDERRVQIQGEAYFEIAHDATKPFIVSVNGMGVQVLGTHFNINSYSDEAAVKTSLLEGSIRLQQKNGKTILLQPGQQAQAGQAGDIKVVNNVDMEEVVAWKNGYFSFNHADLQTVMRQIARWYDVDISYEGNVPERSFGGKIDRNSNASEVLKILEESKVHFTIDGKKIIVKP